MAERVARDFARRRGFASRWLDVEVDSHVVVHIVRDYTGMRRAAGAGAPEWATAVCRNDDVIVLRYDKVDKNPADSLGIVLAHEVTHNVLSHLGGLPLPRWFEEGLCVQHAGVAYLELDTTLQRLGAARRLPTFTEADAYFRSDSKRAAIAYRFGHEAVKRFLRIHGAEAMRTLLKHVRDGMPFEAAFATVTRSDLRAFGEELRKDLTPWLPYLLYILAQDIGLTLLAAGALLVFFGYLRQRFRRERELEQLDREVLGL